MSSLSPSFYSIRGQLVFICLVGVSHACLSCQLSTWSRMIIVTIDSLET
jgi:hypothetical protein